MTRGFQVLGEITGVPRRSWHQLRSRLHDLIWPTEEEATEYLRLLHMMRLEDCHAQGEADASAAPKTGRPPHSRCPCELCRKYWEGFYSRI